MDHIANQTEQDLAHMPSIAAGEAQLRDVPLVIATPSSLRGFGRVVQAADPADVDIVT